MKKTDEKKKSKKLVSVLTFRLFIGVFSAFILTLLFTVIIKYSNSVYSAKQSVKEEALEARAELRCNTAVSIFDLLSQHPDKYYKEGRDEYFKTMSDLFPQYTYITDKNGLIKEAYNNKDVGKSVLDIEQIPPIFNDIRAVTEIYSGNLEENGYKISQFVTTKSVYTLDKKEKVYYSVYYEYDKPDDYFVFAVPEGLWDAMQFLQTSSIVYNKTIGEEGYLIVADSYGTIVDSYHNMLIPGKFPNMDILKRFETGEDIETEQINDSTLTFFEEPLTSDVRVTSGEGIVNGKNSYYYAVDIGNDTYVIGVSPVMETLTSTLRLLVFYIIEVSFVFIVLFFLLRALIRRVVVTRIMSVNDSLGEITDGNLDLKVEVTGTEEFENLSSDINHMVDRLKGYIEEEKERIANELSMAEAIQNSALPNLFPPYPEHKEFELYASMNAAKEVGGDFYDYHLIDDHKLVFLIADVSGKSIGGAMFMMLSKTVISDLVEQRLTPGEVFTQANNKLLQNNDEGMFVTAWLGYLDIDTGIIRFTNAGHKPAILIRNGKAVNLISKTNLMLSGIPDMEYEEEEIHLQPGDLLYIYTDGVSEAEDPEQNQYGTKRLIDKLSYGKTTPEPGSEGGLPQTVCEQVYEDVRDFMGDAEQFDDITMLCIRYFGK